MKGTGTWTVQSALDLGVPVNAIAEAVFARASSSHRELREHAQSALEGPDRSLTDVDEASRQGFINDVRDALWASKVVAYAQGLDLIRTAGEEYGWDINAAEVAKIWRAGCIIRAKLLERIRSEYAAGNLVTLLEARASRPSSRDVRTPGAERCVVPSQRAYRCLALPRRSPTMTPFARRELTLRSRRVCGTFSAPIPTTAQTKKGPSTHCGPATAARSTSTEPAGC